MNENDPLEIIGKYVVFTSSKQVERCQSFAGGTYMFVEAESTVRFKQVTRYLLSEFASDGEYGGLKDMKKLLKERHGNISAE
jgi:hypothetical protein